jgi:hypothetical protein
VHRREQCLDRCRGKLALWNEAKGWTARHKSSEVTVVETGRKDHIDRYVEPREPFGDLEPIDVGQLDIEKNEVRTVLLRPFDAVDASFGLGHHKESMALEQLTRDFPEVAVVVDEENGA